MFSMRGLVNIGGKQVSNILQPHTGCMLINCFLRRREGVGVGGCAG